MAKKKAMKAPTAQMTTLSIRSDDAMRLRRLVDTLDPPPKIMDFFGRMVREAEFRRHRYGTPYDHDYDPNWELTDGKSGSG